MENAVVGCIEDGDGELGGLLVLEGEEEPMIG